MASLITAFAFVLNVSNGDWRCAIAFGAVLGAAVLAVRGWQKSPSGPLRWDGESWHWSGFAEMQMCRLVLLLDLQRAVLVRLDHVDQSPVWLWLEAIPGDIHWMPLRRAIVSSLRDGAGNASTDAGEFA